uniref:7TM_GPCR_Srx domain-containing protein n=1 Tax=Steinernema glaseri TaxID=37863 RepID=A0A1I7YVU9_9BILA
MDSDTDIPIHYYISTSIFIVSGAALFLNVISILFALKKPFKDTVFGVFLLFKGIQCSICAFIFFIWSFPLSVDPYLFNFVPLAIRRGIGIFLITADGNATFFTFLVSVNRFVVLFFLRHKKGEHHAAAARVFSMCVVLAGIGVSSYIHLRGDGLYPTYTNLWFDWGVGKETPVGIYKIYYFYGMRILSLSLDIIAFIKLRIVIRKMRVNTQQNISFDTYFFYLITTQHFAAFANTVFYTKFMYFPWMTTGLSYTLRYGMWQFCYLLDGLSCLMMSKALRLRVRKLINHVKGIQPKIVNVTRASKFLS